MWWRCVATAESGNAPRLALLHGFLGTPASFGDLAAALGGEAEIHAATLPWHGAPPRAPRGRTFDAVVDELAGALPGGAPFWLVGYSLGGRIALRMALRHAQRVAGAILIGAHPGLVAAEERQARARHDELQAARLARGGLAAFVTEWERQPLFASQARLPESVQKRQRAARRSHTRAVGQALRTLGLGRMPEMWGELAAAALPLWFVAGALDDKFADLARRASVRAPRGELVLVPGAGHNPLLEAPQEVTRIVRQAIGI